MKKEIIILILIASLVIFISCAPPDPDPVVEGSSKPIALKIKWLQNKIAAKPPVDTGTENDADNDGLPDGADGDDNDDGIIENDTDSDGIANEEDLNIDGDSFNNDEDDDIDDDGTFNWQDDDMDADTVLNDIDTDDNSNLLPDAAALDMTIRDINDPWQVINLGQRKSAWFTSGDNTMLGLDFGHFAVWGGDWLLNYHGDNFTVYPNVGNDNNNNKEPYIILEEGQPAGTATINHSDLATNPTTTSSMSYFFSALTLSGDISKNANKYTVVLNYKPTTATTNGAEFEYLFKYQVDGSQGGVGECVGIIVKDSNGNILEELGDTDTNPDNYTPTGH